MPNKEQAIAQAEKQVNGVLENLEEDTQSEVKKIELEDVVEIDKDTGRPSVQKAVDITVTPKPERKWSR